MALKRRIGRTVRALLADRTPAGRLLRKHADVAELVARQYGGDGFRRLDLFVLYAAIEDTESGEGDGLDLLERLLCADASTRVTDPALLTLLRRGPLLSSRFVTARAVIDSEAQLVGDLADLAIAIHRGDRLIPCDVRKRRPPLIRDATWFRSNGFTAAEVDRLEAVQARVYRKLGVLERPWPVLEQIGDVLRSHLDPNDRMHGLGGFYQSCEDLLIDGQRPTRERFEAYGLLDVLRPHHQVLDIGCNCGFLALHCAPHVKAVHGFDINPRFIAIANDACRYLGRNNCRFTTSSFDEFRDAPPCDVVFSFAVHHWIGAPMDVYAERLRQHLVRGGLVLLESQDLRTFDVDWDERLRAFCDTGFEALRSGTISDDGRRTRCHVLLRDVARS